MFSPQGQEIVEWQEGDEFRREGSQGRLLWLGKADRKSVTFII